MLINSTLGSDCRYRVVWYSNSLLVLLMKCFIFKPEFTLWNVWSYGKFMLQVWSDDVISWPGLVLWLWWLLEGGVRVSAQLILNWLWTPTCCAWNWRSPGYCRVGWGRLKNQKCLPCCFYAILWGSRIVWGFFILFWVCGCSFGFFGGTGLVFFVFLK